MSMNELFAQLATDAATAEPQASDPADEPGIQHQEPANDNDDPEALADADDDDGGTEVGGDADGGEEPEELFKFKLTDDEGNETDEEVSVSREELQRSYLRRQDYTRKTQELSQMRKEARNALSAAQQQRDTLQGWFGRIAQDPKTMVDEFEKVLGPGVVRAAIDARIEELVELENLPPDKRLQRDREKLESDRQRFTQQQQQRQQQEAMAQQQQYWLQRFQEWGEPAFKAARLPETQANWQRVQTALQPYFQSGSPLTEKEFREAVAEAAEEWRQEQSGHLSTLDDPEALIETLGEERAKKLMAHLAKQQQKKKARSPGTQPARRSSARPANDNGDEGIPLGDLHEHLMQRYGGGQ